MRRTSPTARRVLAGVLLAAAALLPSCAVGAGDDLAEAGAGDAVAEAPEECRGPFPLATGDADAADLDGVPAGFPDPPAGSVLCETGGRPDGGQEYAHYATALPAEEVLAHYTAGGPGAELGRTGLGAPAVTGTAGAVSWIVEPVDGGFRVVFTPAS